MREKQLLHYLKGACTGRKYRASGAELERALGLRGTDLRRLVNRLRRRGVPIASDRRGYFYAATAGEVYGTIRQLRQMADGLEKAIAGLEAALEGFGESGDAGGGGVPAQAQRSGLRGERRSDEAGELLPKGGSEQAESATT